MAHHTGTGSDSGNTCGCNVHIFIPGRMILVTTTVHSVFLFLFSEIYSRVHFGSFATVHKLNYVIILIFSSFKSLTSLLLQINYYYRCQFS